MIGSNGPARYRRSLARRIAVAALACVAVLICPARADADADAASVKAASVGTAAVARTVSVSGSTLDVFGRTLAGVQLRFQRETEDGATHLRVAESDNFGRFKIAGLAPGVYRLIAVKGGYAVLVGQVNTLAEQALELILRPAGEVGAPGERPSDGSWVLRIPKRDALEDRSHRSPELAASAVASGPVGLSVPVSVLLTASMRDGGSGAGGEAASGLDAQIGSTFEVSDAGFFAVSYRHRNEGSEASAIDRQDRLQARYVPRPGSGAFPVMIGIDASRLRRDRESTQTRSDLHVLSEGAEFEARWTGGGSDGTVTAMLDAAMLGAVQEIGGDWDDVLDSPEASASRVSLTVVGQRGWGESGETSYEANVSTVSGGRLAGGDLALLPIVAGDDLPRLDALDATSAGIRVENSFASRRLGGQLATRMRLQHVAGLEDVMRASASFGGRWALPAGIVLLVDGGCSVQGDGDATPIWAASLSGGRERFTWSVSGRREIGLAPWIEPSLGEPRSAQLLLATDGDGDILRWAASASWRRSSDWPELSLLYEQFEVSGRLAAHLPGDVPWVPVADGGSGVGAAVDFVIDNASTGTLVGVGWSAVEDQGPAGMLLSGARQWTWQQVTVRQRLGASDWQGANWQLVLGVEQGKVAPGETPAADSGRLALLSQRRVSGGVALEF